MVSLLQANCKTQPLPSVTWECLAFNHLDRSSTNQTLPSLGLAATVEKPVVVNGEIVIRPIMSLGLTIDHRVVDGMAGAKFMKDLKALIEDPISMLV